MNLLDTDALSHLQKNDPVGAAIKERIDESPDADFWITTVNAYEMLSGAIDLIRELQRKRKALTPGFQLLHELIDYLHDWRGRILPYDDAADQVHQRFAPRLRQELKYDARIAAIAVAHRAAVWTCNVADYRRVPGLTVVQANTGTVVP